MAKQPCPAAETSIVDKTLPRSCDVCCHCGNGIPYMTVYTYCFFCDLSVCESCRRSHPRSHFSFTKSVKDYATARGAAADEKICISCEETIHCRLSCNDCDMTLCLGCITAFQDDLVDHEHRNMTFIRTPDDYGLQKYDLVCHSCADGQTMQHCDRCQEGIKVGEAVYECTTCLKEYAYSTVLCASCHADHSHDHDPSHRFVSSRFVIDENAAEEYQPDLVCAECNTLLEDGPESLVEHPHSSYHITCGILEKERLVFQSYRNCARKPIRSILTIDESCHDIECGCCLQNAALNSNMYFCSTCEFKSCSRCAESGGARAQAHQLFPITLKRTLQRKIANQPPHQWCVLCKEPVHEGVSTFVECSHCHRFNICSQCIAKSGSILSEHSCGFETPNLTYFDPIELSPTWLAKPANQGKPVSRTEGTLPKLGLAGEPAGKAPRVQTSVQTSAQTTPISTSMPILDTKKADTSSLKRKPVGPNSGSGYQTRAVGTNPNPDPNAETGPHTNLSTRHQGTADSARSQAHASSTTPVIHRSSTEPSPHPQKTLQSPISMEGPLSPEKTNLSLAGSEPSTQMESGVPLVSVRSAPAERKHKHKHEPKPSNLLSQQSLQHLSQKFPSTHEMQQMYTKIRKNPKTKLGLKILKNSVHVAAQATKAVRKIEAITGGIDDSGSIPDVDTDFGGGDVDFTNTSSSPVDFSGGEIDATSISDSSVDFSGGDTNVDFSDGGLFSGTTGDTDTGFFFGSSS